MEKEQNVREDLIHEFQSTLIQDVLPGILHNFANPLNGIMGRSQLLQKRAREAFASTAERPSEAACEKILRDVELIAEQGDRLYDLFSSVSGKIRRLHDWKSGPVNISELVSSEVSFFDFYLDFKHSIEKNLSLNMDVPAVTGVSADYSLALSSIIRCVMISMRESSVRQLSVYTDYDSRFVLVSIGDTGTHDESFHQAVKMPGTEDAGVLDGYRGLCNALRLLDKYHVLVSSETSAGMNKITLSIPYGS